MIFKKKSDEAIIEEIATKKQKKVKRVRNTRRLRFGTASTVLTVVVIVGVLLLNVLVGIVADKYPVTWDLSSDQVFTLSEDSVAIAESVKNDVEIVVFADEETFVNPTLGNYYESYYGSNFATGMNTTLKEFYMILQQYKSHSDSKVTYQFINPDQEPTKYAAYADYEVAAEDILFISGERHRSCTVNDLFEVISDSYYSTYSIESKVEKILASNIHALQSENDRIVQVLVGHEEDSYVIDGLKTLYELNGYTFEEINITGSSEFNENAEIMLIAAPAKDYSDAEVQRVQQWVYNNGNYGHHLLVFTSATVDCPNLYELLDIEYGIQVTNELLLETDLNRVQNYSAYYPMCDVPETDYTLNSVSTSKVCTPLARRLTTSLSATAGDEEATISHLGIPLTSYPESAQLIKLEDFEAENTEGVYNAEDGEYPLTSMIASVINSYNNNTYENTYGTVVVSGCAAMADSSLVQYASFNNEDLLLDVVNGVTGHVDSLSISNKVLTEGTVDFDGGVQIALGLGVFTIGLPILLLVICLVVFLRRKNL